MLHATQVLLTKRILDFAERGATEMGSDIFLNPIASYVSVSQQQREHELLFRKCPQLMGLSSDLPRPGDYLTDDLGIVPILVVRTKQGGLNAFVNVCRHRGAKVVKGNGHGASSFTCPYHGWNYDLNGKLRQLTPQNSFGSLTCADRSLVALPVVEKYGFIWVYPTPDSVPDIDGHLAGLGSEFAAYNFKDFAHYETRVLHKDINWKLVIDTFLENWHFSTLHRTTILPIFLPSLSIYDSFGDNGRLIMPRRSILDLRNEPEENWDLLKHSVVLYIMFPNYILAWQGDHLETWRTYPVVGRHPGESVSEASLYTPHPATTQKERGYWDKNMELLMLTVTNEDFPIMADVQKGFMSGAQEHMTFGRNEPALHHYHKAIQTAVGDR